MKTGDRACALLLLLLTSASCYDTSSPSAGGETHFLCMQDADCSELGSGHTCYQGICMSATERETAERLAVAPVALLLVDSSGSMERMPECQCTTPECDECLPRCEEGEQNRWASVLAALTGEYEDFSCARVERADSSGFTYDVGYYLPYVRPSGTQIEDGVLDQYAERVRFGLATFDAWDTYVGASNLVPAADFAQHESQGEMGMWSYDPTARLGILNQGRPIGTFQYPNCTTDYRMDTGIRGPDAVEGALRLAISGATASGINLEIQEQLARTRPYGGTPMAAALDDLYYFFAHDPATSALRDEPARKHVVLITDGYPDDDWRKHGCNCRNEGDPDDPEYALRCGPLPNEPALMHCPYPTPEEVAVRLTCSPSGCGGGQGTIYALHVVGFAIDDAQVIERLDAIARAGGTRAAHLTRNAQELRDALTRVLEFIASEPNVIGPAIER